MSGVWFVCHGLLFPDLLCDRFFMLQCWVGSLIFFFFKQKTAYEMRIGVWSSDVCSSDLADRRERDDRTARVVDALAEQVLAEAALLALEHVGQRLQRTLVGAGDDAAAAAVVEQCVDGFLQHALFVAHDDVRRAQRSEERRVGKECGSTCRSRWWPY